MKFYGFHKTTLLDYPGHIASVLFTGGCNMRCPYCHNPELVLINDFSNPVIDDVGVLKFIDKRKGILEGICITGGEPFLYGDELLKFIDQVKAKGLVVKVDTNGSFPDLLAKANVDYIAMDLKTAPDKYNIVGYTASDTEIKIKKSIDYIMNSGKGYEFRTTVVPGVVDMVDIEIISDMIVGADNFVLSQFRPTKTLNALYEYINPYEISVLEEMRDICMKKNINCTIRANYLT